MTTKTSTKPAVTTQAVKHDAHDIDTKLGEKIASADGVVSRFFNEETQQPRIIISTDDIVRSKARQMKAQAPGRRALLNGTRKVQRHIKNRCADSETWLGRVHLDTKGTSLDPMTDENVGQVVFAALTDEDNTIASLASKAEDFEGECDAIAVYFDGSIAPPRTLRDGAVVPDRYAPANYIGIVATYGSVDEAVEAAAELRSAVQFGAHPSTDTAMNDDPIRTVGMDRVDPFDSL